MNIFKRRERTEQATADPPDEIAKLRIELEEAQAYAESREKMRARWEILYWRQLERFAKLHTALDEARRETRQAHQDRARAEQAAAEAERLHRERRLA